MGKKYDLIVPAVNEIFEQYDTKMTLRQIYYRLVVKLIIENTLSQYKSLSHILVKARENGDVDYRMIEDRARTTIGGDFGYDDEDDFIQTKEDEFNNSWERFSMPMWLNQPKYVEVWVEKDALSRLVSDVANGYRVRTCPSRGYSSFTYIMDAVQRLNIIDDKEIVILYLGDFDPSGLDITRDLYDRLIKYGANLSVKPLALNIEQIRKYDLPPMPAKKTDSRLAKFISETGASDAVELDALEPPILKEIVDEGIKDLIDSKLWTKRIAEIDEIKENLRIKVQNSYIYWDE